MCWSTKAYRRTTPTQPSPVYYIVTSLRRICIWSFLILSRFLWWALPNYVSPESQPNICTNFFSPSWVLRVPSNSSSIAVTVQINQPTRYNNFSSLLLDTFLASSRPSSGAQQLQPLVLPLQRSGGCAAGRVRAGRPNHDQQHSHHHAPKVKPEATTAVVELLMMGVRTPEAVHKRQVINWRNCCI